MAERNGAAVDVEPGGIGASGLQPRRRHRRESLVHFEQVDVVNRHAGLLQRALSRMQGRIQHDHGVPAHHGHVMDPCHRLDPERLQALFIDDNHAGGAVADLAGTRSGELAVFRDQFDALDAIKADVEATAFVDVVGVGRAIGARDLQRNDLVLEFAGLGCGNRALMAVVGIFVQVVPRQAVLFRHHFGAGELAEYNVGVALLDVRALVGAEAVLGRQLRCKAHRHARHRFDTGGDHAIHAAGHHRLCGEMQCLLRRTALPVDRCSRHALRQF